MVAESLAFISLRGWICFPSHWIYTGLRFPWALWHEGVEWHYACPRPTEDCKLLLWSLKVLSCHSKVISQVEIPHGEDLRLHGQGEEPSWGQLSRHPPSTGTGMWMKLYGPSRTFQLNITVGCHSMSNREELPSQVCPISDPWNH